MSNQNSTAELNLKDAPCHILHIDMDAFFASVEVSSRPELAGKQVIIGHEGGRGVVLSATYPARARGVHSAMPMSRALRLAPDAVVIAPDMSKYAKVSKRVMEIFHQMTPLVQPLSIDEAFLDVSGATKLIGSPLHIAREIRKQVWNQEQITCSVGIAPTMFVAKLATNKAKPDGIYVITPDQVIEFLHALPITAMWGVGAKTAEQLGRLGLTTVADIANTPVKTLARVIGQAHATQLHELSWGRDLRNVTPEHTERSIGAERTFDSDTDDLAELANHFMALSDTVARKLRHSNNAARTISIKVRFSDFKTVTRSKTLANPTNLAHEIFQVTQSLITSMNLQRIRIRLVGVRAENLVPDSDISTQLQLGDRAAGWREAESVLDKVAGKFGQNKLRQARLISPNYVDSPDFIGDAGE
ncbi:MAG: DNA polymerase IV [Actinobacteria bacterium]|nr:DNA polymerase IV [Actinomycetota bacterium]NBY15629.1 DNA polymerase IV [Actinomycetota bacterium]